MMFTTRAALSWVVFCLVFVPSVPAIADRASCLDIKNSPVERLVCIDGGLAAMDDAVEEARAKRQAGLPTAEAEALAKAQRAWSGARGTGCSLPDFTDETLSFSDLWRGARCLAGLYRERLAQLGAPYEPARPAALDKPNYIHPLCLGAAVSDETGKRVPVPLRACQLGNEHNVPEVQEGYLVAKGGPLSPSTRIPYTWFGYQRLGTLADGREVFLVAHVTGGSGFLSSIETVRRKPGKAGEVMLSAKTLIQGGDRCEGGIKTASLKGDMLTMRSNVQPGTWLNAGGHASPRIIYYKSCSACCIGTLLWQRSVGGGKEKVLSGTLNEDYADNISQEDDANLCFTTAVRKVGVTPSKDIDIKTIRSIVRAHHRCLEKSR